jgi:DtxR family transcriptional regulator, Mn-dependent transcriptional regulator
MEMTLTPLSESLEDYLEAIFQIEERKQVVRAKDIADRLQVKGSSVTGALQQLARRDLVNYAPYDLVTLTESGREAASEVVRRHEALREFMVGVLDVEERMAEKCACRMEHAMPRPILDRLVRFVEFCSARPESGRRGLIEEFKRDLASREENGSGRE